MIMGKKNVHLFFEVSHKTFKMCRKAWFGILFYFILFFLLLKVFLWTGFGDLWNSGRRISCPWFMISTEFQITRSGRCFQRSSWWQINLTFKLDQKIKIETTNCFPVMHIESSSAVLTYRFLNLEKMLNKYITAFFKCESSLEVWPLHRWETFED